jgi:uncharacterized membrane protein YdcZ (DUF606 family)
VLDARLPAAIDPPPALSYSNYIVGLVVLLSLLIVGRRRIRA